MSDKAKATAAKMFEKDATLKEVYATTDGQVFPVENHAWNHAKALNKTNPDVAKIEREPEAVEEVKEEEE